MQTLSVGERIMRAREYRHLTIVELSRRLNVADGTVWRWEKDRNRPQVHHLVRVAAVLDVPLAYLAAENVVIAKVGRQYPGPWEGGR